MEMGKLTAKLRDAVPVCFLVEGKEIKRYKNIEIPDDLKKLEFQDFKFDVPLNGAITFKIMFEPGVLPEKFPKERERKTRKSLTQELQPQDEQSAESLPAETVEALAQALEDTKATGEPVDAIAKAVRNGEAIKAEIIGDEAVGRMLVFTAEITEATAPPVIEIPANKPTRIGKGKKGAAIAGGFVK